MKSRVFILLAALAVLAMPIPNAAARDLKAERLFHRLQHLPAGATPASVVVKALLPLVKRHPTLAYKYYRVAITRLDSTSGTPAAVATKLAILVANIVKKAGLSAAQLKKFIYFGPTDYTPPTPTPSPTP